MCLTSEGIDYHILLAAKERCQNVFVLSLRMHRIALSEEECKFLLGV